MKLIVHIGMHKAASSSIQKFVRDNADVLERHGVIVPKGSEGGLDQKKLVFEIFGDKNIRGLTEEYMAQPGRYWMNRIEELYREHAGNPESKALFLSSEVYEYYARSGKKFSKLADWLGRFASEIEIMAVIRDQASYLNSRYCQGAKTLNRTDGFEEFLGRVLERNRLDYTLRFRGLLKSKLAFNAVPFCRLVRSGVQRELIDNVFGIQEPRIYDELVSPNQVNPNPGSKTVAASIELSRGVAERLAGRSMPERVRRRLTHHLFAMAWERGWHETAFAGLDDDRAREIMDVFADSNDAFARTVWGADWPEIYPPREFTRSVFSFDEASREEQEEYLEVVRRLYEWFDKLMADEEASSTQQDPALVS